MGLGSDSIYCNHKNDGGETSELWGKIGVGSLWYCSTPATYRVVLVISLFLLKGPEMRFASIQLVPVEEKEQSRKENERVRYMNVILRGS